MVIHISLVDSEPYSEISKEGGAEIRESRAAGVKIAGEHKGKRLTCIL